MNVISKPARQALVGWGDQEEQGLTVNGVKPAGKLPLKMPINSEPSCFTSYLIIRSNYKMSPNHRSGNSWIHMYILYIVYMFQVPGPPPTPPAMVMVITHQPPSPLWNGWVLGRGGGHPTQTNRNATGRIR